MMQGFPIIKHPHPEAQVPILVSIPHYGTQPLPHITAADYTEPWFETFAYGFADTFVGDLYADLHEQGATVLATPFSRILSLIHISEPTRLLSISYAVFC